MVVRVVLHIGVAGVVRPPSAVSISVKNIWTRAVQEGEAWSRRRNIKELRSSNAVGIPPLSSDKLCLLSHEYSANPRAAVLVPAPPQIVFHLGDCLRDGRSVILLGWLQIPSLYQSGDHLLRGRLMKGANDVTYYDVSEQATPCLSIRR